MKKCLKIIFTMHNREKFLHEFIQINARKLDIEGTAQIVEPDQVIIIVCGSKENIDTFVDILHEGFDSDIPKNVQVEPFIKSKDYRGVFRVIE